MNLFEIVLANCIRASRQQDKQHQRVDTDLPTRRAMITRFAAVAALFAISVLALDTAGERYERKLANNAVAATRQ